jgi:hypothetical protein
LAEVELFLRLSDTDVLSSIQGAAYQVKLHTGENKLLATASTDKDWGQA